MLKRLWRNDEGVLTFEWILLLTLLVIGVIGGLAAIRDAIIHESQGTVGAMVNLDQTYDLQFPLGVSVLGGPGDTNCSSGASYSQFGDQAFWDVNRFTTSAIQFNQAAVPGSQLCPLP